ncbi:hypothetical protein C0Q70_09052 [Pomacea canaliculata]|uniref:Sodium-coupled monocarboxylate transporter 1 n=1 Tax=Pomacea canaliculata TaxID=400727 RepID=A0A2T7P8P7_POMCA|nr:hypothetical protein C0Q70_09052 [Pomacea canaliculata]
MSPGTGGIKSVVWTDVFQTGVYVIGVGTVIVMCTLHVGSLTQAFRLASEGGRIEFNQAFLLSAPINLLNECILTLMGVLLYAYVVTIGCDPYQAGIIDNRNQMIPYFVPSLLGSLPGMPGLYMSMLFSGALSTLSSGINAMGANTVEDLLARPLRGYKDATVTVIAKISGRHRRWTHWHRCQPVDNCWLLAVRRPYTCLTPGPTHNCPANNSYSSSFHNLTTVDISMTDEMSTDTNPNSNITNLFQTQRANTFSIYDISYLWISPIGFFVTLITGVIISFITGSTNKAALDPKLVFPFTRKLFRMKDASQEAEDSSHVIVMKEEYLLGNRQMSMIPVCLSMFITYQSAIALLVYLPSPYLSIVSLFTAVPLLYPLKITSVNEYLELRFDSKFVRLFATILCMLRTGGIKSVVWTDVFQTGVYVIGVGTVIVMCTLHVGSLTQAFRLASEGGRIEFNQISPDVRERHSLWATLIGGCFTLFTGFTQSSAQRISSLKTLKKAKLAFLLNAPINLLNECILTVTGVLLYAYVVTIGCDPYQAGIIDNRNQMMPYFVPSLLGSLPGMPGLYISMLFSGALSTLSSGINSLGANTVEDLLARPLRGYKDATVTVIAKISVLLFGALGIGLAYLARSLRGPVTQGAVGGGLIGIAVNLWITVGSLLYGAPTLALPPGPTHNCSGNNSYSFSFYNLSTDTNPNSNITNLFHSQRADTFSIYDISYLWIAVIGFFVTLSTGIIISFITGSTNKATLNPKLVFPFTRKLFRMKEPSQEAEDSSDVLVMKTYQNPAEKCIGNTDTMDEDHLSVQPLM